MHAVKKKNLHRLELWPVAGHRLLSEFLRCSTLGKIYDIIDWPSVGLLRNVLQDQSKLTFTFWLKLLILQNNLPFDWELCFSFCRGFLRFTSNGWKECTQNPCEVAAIIYNKRSSMIIYKAFNCPNVRIVYYLSFLLLLWMINHLPYWPPFISDPPLKFCKFLDNEKQILNFQDETRHSQGLPLPLWGTGELDSMPMELPRKEQLSEDMGISREYLWRGEAFWHIWRVSERWGVWRKAGTCDGTGAAACLPTDLGLQGGLG